MIIRVNRGVLGKMHTAYLSNTHNCATVCSPISISKRLQATHTAKPIVRALVIDYPHDRNVWHIDDQYLFGDSMLIAPILASLEESTQRTLYLPAGIWIDYWNKEVINSRGEWIERPIDLETMPIYVKAGSIIPYGADKESTNNEIGAIVRLEVFRGASNALCYDDGVSSFHASFDGEVLKLTGLADIPAIDYFG